jgi:integrase
MPVLAKGFNDDWLDKIRFKAKLKTAKRGKNAGKQIVQRQQTYFERMETGLSLALVVSSGGRKTWRAITYSDSGRAQSHMLGTTDKYKTVEDAKNAAKLYRKDPKKFEGKQKAGTFEEVVKEFLKRYVHEHKLITAKEIERKLTKYIPARIKHKRFTDVDRDDLRELRNDIVDAHGAAMANGVLSSISSLCSWYENDHSDYTSPFPRGRRRHGKQIAKHRTRTLTDHEIKLIWQQDGQFADILKLCLLTAQRKDKVANMRDTDITNDIWTIPRTHPNEKGTARAIRLPALALDIIERQPRLYNNHLIFPNGAGNKINAWGQRKSEMDILVKIPHWTPHDLRRTAKTLMSRLKVAPYISERVLGHEKQGVEKIYDQWENFEEKSQAVQALADLIQQICIGA